MSQNIPAYRNTAVELCVFGASVRAACWSAARAGIPVRGADLFGDLDFPPGIEVERVEELSAAAFQRAVLGSGSPEGDEPRILLTGGTESLVADAQISYGDWLTRRVTVSDAGARDPLFLARLLQEQQLPFLAVRDLTGCVVGDLQRDHVAEESAFWLRKKRNGTGGLGVRRLAPEDSALPAVDEYDQQYCAGPVFSAQFLSQVSRSRSRHTELLGGTVQMTGDPAVPEKLFLYSGNLYPLEEFVEPAAQPDRTQLLELGSLLAERCGINGIWGLDFVVDEVRIYPLEVNSRYTAAVELVELHSGRALLTDCRECSEAGFTPMHQPLPSRRAIGKRILYADREIQLPVDWDWTGAVRTLGGDEWRYGAWDIPMVSDLPRGGTSFSHGEPVCTIWGWGATGPECRERLEQQHRAVSALLHSRACRSPLTESEFSPLNSES